MDEIQRQQYIHNGEDVSFFFVNYVLEYEKANKKAKTKSYVEVVKSIFEDQYSLFATHENAGGFYMLGYIDTDDIRMRLLYGENNYLLIAKAIDNYFENKDAKLSTSVNIYGVRTLNPKWLGAIAGMGACIIGCMMGTIIEP